MVTRNFCVRLRVMIACCVVFGISSIRLEAQPRALFQFGTSQGLDNRLTISRVPVIDATGAVKYYDVAFAFTVDGAGKLALNSGATKIMASPNLTVGAFKPGIYLGGPGGCQHIVGTPGVAGGTRASGSIADDEDDCALSLFEFNASWVSGPIAGHPNEAVLRAAGITFEGYSWGILGDVGPDWDDRVWKAGDIIGVVQSGQQLTIHNFGNDKKEDTSATFTLCPSCH